MTTYTSVFGNEAIPAADQPYASLTLTADSELMWPEIAVGDLLLYELMDLHASAARNLILPAANLVSVGRPTTLSNKSAYTITVRDAGNAEVTSLNSGESKLLYITDNSTAAGAWGVVFLGTGTSVADASALAGSGLKVVDSKLGLNLDSFSQIASYTLLETDRARAIVFNSSGAVTLNLLQASVAGNGFIVPVSNLGAGALNAEPFGLELIDEESSKAFAPGESAFLVCDGIGWFTVGHGRSTQFQFTKLVFDVSVGMPFTLTSTQAQNKLIQFIGTATQNITVNVPSVVAVYYTQCAYSGSYSLTLKTASGAGVALSNTDRAIVYCDGVDVVLAQTSAAPATNLTGGVAGAVVYQAGIGDTAFTSAGTAGQVLTSQGTSAPTWSNLYFSSFAGTVPVNKGGTGATTLTTGGLLRGNGASPVSIASAADIVAAIGATKVQAATSADNGGVTSVNGQTGAVTITAGVTSVAGRTGAVTLSKSDVGLSNVDNTADASKSVDNSAKLGGVAAANYSQTSHTHSYAPMTAVVAISNAAYNEYPSHYYCTATRANGATFTFISSYH